MDIALHIGANCTDGERLLRSLLRNVDALAGRGVAVPGPGRYRKVLREAVMAVMGGQGAEGARDVLLDAILDGRDVGRVVLSSSTFLALPARLFDGGFLGRAGARAAALRRLFPGDRVELFLGLRNPATFVPAVWGQAMTSDLPGWLGGVDPRAIRWSEVVAGLREAAPEMPLTVWLNEDTPLIWGELLARLAGAPPDGALEGRHDLLAAIMSPDGFERFSTYMANHSGQTPMQERRVIGAFLDKFALPEAIEEEVDLPGWDHALVDDLTRAYEEDCARIAAMDVAFVQP